MPGCPQGADGPARSTEESEVLTAPDVLRSDSASASDSCVTKSAKRTSRRESAAAPGGSQSRSGVIDESESSLEADEPLIVRPSTRVVPPRCPFFFHWNFVNFGSWVKWP